MPPPPAVPGARSIEPAAILKEAGLAALVALGLSIIILGLRTVDQPGGLGLETRWGHHPMPTHRE